MEFTTTPEERADVMMRARLAMDDARKALISTYDHRHVPQIRELKARALELEYAEQEIREEVEQDAADFDFEALAVRLLNAEGIDATYQNTGGGCMVAEVLLFDGEAEVDDGPHIMVTASDDTEKWMIGFYEEFGSEGTYAFADTDETMVKAVRAFMDR